MSNGLRICAGNANLKLVEEISKHLKIRPVASEVANFNDGEINVKIKENVRGEDVFVIQPTCPPVNNNLMELLIIIDALKRASARRITAVLPYYGYARQDRKVEPRVPITAKLVANLITKAGANRILAMDLHAGQLQGYFDIPVDHLFAAPVLVEYFNHKKILNLVTISPDAGGVERARAFAKRLQRESALGFIDKRRPAPGKAEMNYVVGDVQGKNVVILDDIIDSAGTLVKAAEVLKKNGALDIYAACTHPVLSGLALERIRGSVLKEVIVTNTIPLREDAQGKIKVLSVAKLLADSIKRIHEEESLSSLFI
ncbi:MAG: ribose-phosphate pyrophosphokinase [bacterium]|nr:ribose-phosphate pyrophosphokinase [bacterium]MDD5353887.1 ribose-phosphate pyrophosphokinase [bacterium]MDD5756997.1 ribose-phosphate pyrophosphokinase [bacterium]